MQIYLGVNHIVLNDKVKFLLNESTVKICLYFIFIYNLN